MWDSKVFEEITVSGVVKSLTAEYIQPTTSPPVPRRNRAYIVTRGGHFFFRVDGGDPTGSLGHPCYSPSELVISGANDMRNFRAIKMADGEDAVISVSYQAG